MADWTTVRPPQPGQVRLWRGAFPDLDTGSYEVRLTQTLQDGTTGEAIGEPDPVAVHLDVEGPRFTLPGPEVHSVFPPANATGSFSTRLPHIALKRRTLPWERSETVANDEPWLALVVLSDLEGHLATGPIADAFSPGVSTGGLPEGTCDRLELAESVFQAVFPSRDDLPWLTHVRQVSLRDAENLRGDLDGWLATVVANRLPARPDTTYGCYLVSLERQLGGLPSPADDAWTHRMGPPLVLGELVHELSRLLLIATEQPPGRAGTGPLRAGARRLNPEDRARFLTVLADEATDVTVGATTIPASTVEAVGRHLLATTGVAAGDGDDLAITDVPGLAVVDTVPPEVVLPAEPVRRFPVLAHWSFTTTGTRDFQALMEGLDVGLMTSVPAGGPPVEPTGHTPVDHVRRDGEAATAWYRGPLVPVRTTRRGPSPRFTSDAALAVTAEADAPDVGLPVVDVSEAAAFEVGRLLALGDPAFLEALGRWRRRSFQRQRRTSLRSVLRDRLRLSDRLAEERLAAAMARLLAIEALHGLHDRLGPVVDPVEHLELFALDEDARILARGFGLEATTVTEALAPGMGAPTAEPGLVDPGAIGVDDLLGELGVTLDATVGGFERAAAGLDPEHIDLRGPHGPR